MSKVDWGNAEQVSKVLKKDGFLLRHASKQLRNDDKVVSRAVQTDGAALQHADLSGILRGNRKVALTAVKQDGEALQFVPRDLRRDREVVTAACSQNGHGKDGVYNGCILFSRPITVFFSFRVSAAVPRTSPALCRRQPEVKRRSGARGHEQRVAKL